MAQDAFSPMVSGTIELDGPQHFSPAAYRKDREKDYLLQEHGYIILRFQVEELGTHLNEVLDRILRVLTRRQSIQA